MVYSLKNVINIILITLLFLFIFAVIGVQLFQVLGIASIQDDCNIEMFISTFGTWVAQWLSKVMFIRKPNFRMSAAGLLACMLQANIRMCSNRLLRLDDSKSSANC